MPDVSVRPVVWAGVAIAVTIAVVIAAVLGLLHLREVPPGGARLDADMPRAAPGLAAAPQEDTARWRREQEARLDGAGWVDRNAGLAHIPIADAMDLLVRRRQAQKGSR